MSKCENPNELIKCRIFELMKGQINKKSRKPPKAYSHPIHHHHHARGLWTEGCLIRVNFPKPWHSRQG